MVILGIFDNEGLTCNFLIVNGHDIAALAGHFL